MSVLVWYDKTATDDRVWCVRRTSDGSTVRASRVDFPSWSATKYKADGFQELQPGGPRGVVFADEAHIFDEVPCG